MDATFVATGIALVLATASLLLVRRARIAAAAAEERMLGMLRSAGAGPEYRHHADVWPILHVARTRCRDCRSTSVCTRWLAAEIAGDNSFCPNADTFRLLARISRRIAASGAIGDDASAMVSVHHAGIGANRFSALRVTPSIHSPIIHAVL